MRRSEWYEVTEPFKGDPVPILDELSDGLPKGHYIGHEAVVANRLPMPCGRIRPLERRSFEWDINPTTVAS